MELSADGLLLRSVHPDDAVELSGLVDANRAFLARWMPWAADQTLAGTRSFIEEAIAQEERGDGYQLAIRDQAAIVGVIGLHAIDWEHRSTTIGYWLTESSQGKGKMSAALACVIDHVFTDLRLHRIGIRIAPDNARSLELARRMGFVIEGTMRESERFGDDYRDLLLSSLLATEWRRQ